MNRVATRERPADRGKRRGIDAASSIGREIRLARRQLGLSLKAVADVVGISVTELWRIEHGLAPWVSLILLAQLCGAVGLDLFARAYPGGRALRDGRQASLLLRLHHRLHVALGWRTEVPLPNAGDQRAWDAAIFGPAWRYGVEAELNPIDGQALLRRVKLKDRDGGMDGVILLLPETRQARLFRTEFSLVLRNEFPVEPRLALKRLAAGEDPGGSCVLVL